MGEARTLYTYSGNGEKLRLVRKWNPNYSAAPVIGSAVNEGALTKTETTDYVGNIVYETGSDGTVKSRILIDGGYIENGVYHFYVTDHLGSVRLVVNQSGTVVQKNHYYPFGLSFAEGLDREKRPYKYTGKELDMKQNMQLYDYSARYYDPTIGRFAMVDPHAENYYSWSPYHYAGNNPLLISDPTGMDWYKDKDGKYQFNNDLTVKNQSEFLEQGQTYIGSTAKIKNKDKMLVDFRSDGSILYANETSAYNRMWSQADNFYKGEKEVGGFTLQDGRVLVTPDFKNEKRDCTPFIYGYKISQDGYVTKGTECFKVTGHIHTHQDPKGDASPSIYTEGGWGDLGYSKGMGGLPVMTIGWDGNIYGVFWSQTRRGYMPIEDLGSRAALLTGKTKLVLWLKTYPTKNK